MAAEDEVDERTPLNNASSAHEVGVNEPRASPLSSHEQSWKTVPKAVFTKDILCLVAATFCFALSDTLITTSYQVLTKEILCCDKFKTYDECHDEEWCEKVDDSTLTSRFSSLLKVQTISNALIGSIALVLWIPIWGSFAPSSDSYSSCQTIKFVLIISHIGVLLYVVAKAGVAYLALQGYITDLTYWLWLVPATFLVGGGALTHWTYRDVVIADAVEETYRGMAYLILNAVPPLAGLLAHFTILATVKISGTFYDLMIAGIIADAIGIVCLLLLSNKPLRVPVTQHWLLDLWHIFQRVLLRKRTRRLILAASASSLLQISTSTFVLVYMPHKFKSTISNMQLEIGLCTCLPNLVMAILRPYLGNIREHAANKFVPLLHRLNGNTSSARVCQANSNNRQETTQSHLTDLVLAMLCLSLAILGTSLMSFATSPNVFLAGMCLVSIAIPYDSLIKPVLASSSSFEERLPAFSMETIINALSRIIGALMLDFGLQKEKGMNSPYALSYLSVMVVCIVCFGVLFSIYKGYRDEDYVSVPEEAASESEDDMGSQSGGSETVSTAND